MRIVQNTPDELVIRDRPVVTSLLMLVMAGLCLWLAFNAPALAAPELRWGVTGFAAAVIFIAWRSLPGITLVFDRPGGAVVRRFSRVTGTSERRVPLRSVRRAGVVRRFGMRQVGLHTETGVLSLEYGLVGLRRRKLASEINRWLAGAR